MSGAQTIAGTVTRLERCEEHGIDYPQTFFPPVSGQAGFWSGTCPDCESDEKLEQRADEMLRAHTAEIIGEAQLVIARREAEIQKRTDKSLAADVAEYKKSRRPLWESYERDVVWNQIVCEVEDRLRTEFLKTQAVPAGR